MYKRVPYITTAQTCLVSPTVMSPVSYFSLFLFNKHEIMIVCFSLPDELGRVRLRHGSKPGSDYINASFIDVCNTTAYLPT